MADAAEPLEDSVEDRVEDATVEQPAVETPAPGKQPRTKPKKGEGKKDEKGQAPELPDGPSVAGHPRAARSIERAKCWGAVGGFFAGFYLSLPTHTLLAAGLRAIAAGTVLYVAVWTGSVFFWRRMVMVEIRAREQQLVAGVRAAQARGAAAQEPQGAGR